MTELKGNRLSKHVLRYTVNEREYELLLKLLQRRAPSALNKRAITTEEYRQFVSSREDYHAATVRSTLRLFLAAGLGLKSWDVISTRLRSRQNNVVQAVTPRTSFIRSPNFRLALSLASILYLNRLLHRFFLRLRLRFLAEAAESLRKKYPHVTRALTSRYAPAIGASLAGFSLGIYPKDQVRVTLAIYMGARGLEFLYNVLDAEGYFKNQPKWMGSWLFYPLALGQLFHAFVFDRECVPPAFGNFLLKHTPDYVQKRPETVLSSVAWPDSPEIVDALAETARLKWPSFISPILLPKHPQPLPSSIDPAISSITSSANPMLHSNPLSCALLHPESPSCLQAFLTHMLSSTPGLLRLFTVIFSALALLRFKAFLKLPLSSLNALCKRIIKTTIIVSSAIGVSWSSICLFQQLLPRKLFPEWRFFLGGFLGGSFTYFGSGDRSTAIYAARVSADSLWKVGVKRRWWKGVKGGDLMLFAAGLGIMGCVLERNPDAVGTGWERKLLNVVNGESELGLNTEKSHQGESEKSKAEPHGSEESEGKLGESEWENVAGKNE